VSKIVEVVIDDREPEGFAELFRRAGAAAVRVERLRIGDFAVNGRWIFERKTVQDFGVSLVDGRLFRQALRMVKAPGEPVIILEGSPGDYAQSRVAREALQGALITLSVFFRIPVLRAADGEELVRLVEYTVAQEGRLQQGGVRRAGYRPKRLRARQIFVLQGLPGIGRERAVKLLERFGSIEEVVSADADELAEVDGIGKLTARRIREVLG